jgi:hypothetical protein
MNGSKKIMMTLENESIHNKHRKILYFKVLKN